MNSSDLKEPRRSLLDELIALGDRTTDRRNVLRLLGLGAGFTAIGPVLAACSPGSGSQSSNLAANQALRLNMGSEPVGIDPVLALSSADTGVERACWDTLLGPNADLTDARPLAAESYQVSSDGLIYTFHIRKTVWTDGQPVKAGDFLYAWRRLLDPRVGASIADPDYIDVIKGALPGYRSLDPTKDADKFPAYLDQLGIAAPDDHTFVVTLSTPAPYFKWLAMLIMGAPVRQDIVEKYGADKWYTDPKTIVTNGPFKVSEIVPKDHYTLVANDKYWAGKPTLAQVTLYEIADQNADFAKYQNGEEDVVTVSAANAKLVASDATLSKQLIHQPIFRTEWLLFNTTMPPFDNLKVRQAISQAIDRDALATNVMRGIAFSAKTLVPKGLVGYTPNASSAQDFNPTKAQATLAESGVSSSVLNKVKILVRNRTYISQVAEFIQGQLKTNLGIQASLEVVDFKSAYPRLTAGSFQMLATYGWQCDYPDPQDYFSVLFGSGAGFNYSRYANPTFDAVVRQGDLATDNSQRTQFYTQAQQMLSSDAPAVFLYQLNANVLVKPYVQNHTFLGIDDWWGDYFIKNITIASH